jgi:hypothetical protein
MTATRALLLLAALLIAACDSPSATDDCPDPADPRVTYIEGTRDNPQRCEVIRFVCNPGGTAFSNECGCGCIRPD